MQGVAYRKGGFNRSGTLNNRSGPNFDQIGAKYNTQPIKFTHPQPPVGAPGPGPGSGGSGWVFFIGFVLYLVPF